MHNQESRTTQNGLTMLGKLYSPQRCNEILARLINEVTWSEDACVIFGRRFEIPRLQAWFADSGIRYSYSNNLLQTQAWIASLLAIKQDVAAITGHDFNAVLLTYYRHGKDHVTWHADDEKELGEAPVIASLSLGETRQFQYRNISNKFTESLSLENGDLLLMHPEFQRNWQHCIPIEESVDRPRINLTFRYVVAPS